MKPESLAPDALITPDLLQRIWDMHHLGKIKTVQKPPQGIGQQLEGMIIGIIDFEWALTGDPAWDFQETCPRSRAILYAGYQSRRALAADHQHRVTLYKLLKWLDSVVLNTFDPGPPAYREAFDLLLHQLEWLEQHPLAN